MIYSNYPFTLDVHGVVSQISFPVSLNDTARTLLISLTDGGKPYEIADGCRAVLAALKPDGTRLLNDCIIVGNKVIRYDFTPQTSAAVGKVDCEVRLYGVDGNIIASPRFTIVVYEGLIDERILSEDEKTSIDRILASEQQRVAAENERIAAEEEREEIAHRAEEAAERVKQSVNGDNVYIRYSAYPDGRDYSTEWQRGLNYIGVAVGLDEPADASGYDWAVFAPSIYVGSGDMPSYADVQIDPAGENDWSGEGNFGSGNTVNMKGYYIKGIDKENCKIYLSMEKLPLAQLRFGAEACEDCYDDTFPTPAYNVGEAFNIINQAHFPWIAAIEAIDHNCVTYTTKYKLVQSDQINYDDVELMGFEGLTGFAPDDDVDGHTFSVPSQPDVGIVQITNNAFVAGVVNNSSGSSGASFGGANLNISNYSLTAGRNSIASYAAAAIGFFCYALHRFTFSIGESTMALAKSSFSQGVGTRALAYAQAVFGKFNKRDTEGKFGLILGGGTGPSDANRKNAAAIEWNGALHLGKGSTRTQVMSFTVGGNKGSENEDEAKYIHEHYVEKGSTWNGSWRYLDNANYITYKYPLKNAALIQKVQWSAILVSQILLQVSTDGVTWNTLLDRGSERLTPPERLTFDLTGYIDPDETEAIYIKLTDSNYADGVSDGNGGAITNNGPVTMTVDRFKMPTLIE